jgi:hypothetical protein
MEEHDMMKKALLLTAILLAALFWAAPAFPGTVPTSVVPEGARWIVHLDVERFVATKLFELLDKDGNIDIKSRDAERWFKIDPRKDLGGVTVFGLGPEDSQIVFAVEGKFDKKAILAQVDRRAEYTETPYGRFTLYSIGKDGYGAFVTDGLIVFSEGRAAVERALDAAEGKAKTFAATDLSAALKEVPAGAFLSGVLPDLTGLGKEIGRSKVLEKASGLFFLAQEKSESLLVRLQVTAASPESAKDMADVVQGLVAMARLSENRGDMAKAKALLEGIKVNLNGKVIKVDFERPSQEIADLLSERHGIHRIFD